MSIIERRGNATGFVVIQKGHSVEAYDARQPISKRVVKRTSCPNWMQSPYYARKLYHCETCAARGRAGFGSG